MIWYLDHSAIAVETNNHLLLFDLLAKRSNRQKRWDWHRGL